eukprot:COSAG02_NODE_1559_length_11928_cov_2.712233_6_plen_103_part_00
MWQDAIAHGSAKRVNPGTRRVCVYRYGPAWGNFRIGEALGHCRLDGKWYLLKGLFDATGYEASEELLDRLTLRRKRIVRPLQNDVHVRPDLGGRQLKPATET